MSPCEVACHFPPKIPSWKAVEPVIKEVSPAPDNAHTSTAEQTKKIPSPSFTTVKGPSVVNSATSRQEDKVGRGAPISSNVDAYTRRKQIVEENRHRAAAIADQIPPRPIYDARSMKRQGKPVPPNDLQLQLVHCHGATIEGSRGLCHPFEFVKSGWCQFEL